MRASSTLLAIALLVSACRAPRSDAADASASSVDAAANEAHVYAAIAPPVWPSSFDADAHCAALHTIAGYVRVVPAWSADAGYLTTWSRDAGLLADFGDDVVGPHVDEDGGSWLLSPGKVVPSAFATCTHGATLGESVNWSTGYSCVAAAAPDEAAANERFAAVAAAWRSCFATSGLKETREPSDSKVVAFRAPGLPAWKHRGCTLDATKPSMTLTCSVGENN